MNDEERKAWDETLAKASEAYTQALKEIENEQEEYWNGLTEEQRLMTFCAVVRRIHKAKFDEMTSYRGTLYSVFGFGMESYVQAQDAGYLDIHNIEYETVDECVSVVKNAVDQRIPASEYAEMIKKHFESKRNEARIRKDQNDQRTDW